eukprot:TRINITY_DN19078_c0_g1::TRINITY_DN19078_c0_g1_i1::g.13992::m.13992 TRINITY_DN19078_c0_g1::TRINITY_DN19078_c0_g1_i1::g.13992  ORF type:complete len:252 (+),score=64.24,sp/Q5F3N1/PIMT_CHICK/40.30/7e-43,PCMT/PF01135.14/1e-45,Methyltransf_18/PF12847.2/0.0019,Methyltransf_18/PF12847.2/1.4e+04,Methyltransf_26/PF13659.1/0.025,Ubie_methyltran/PF01209.13/0.0086,Methyltransf_31/PF13847.1/0.017,Methyltransf_31/PF13847.1/1.4e+03,MTS/PF05175.9/0.08,MTS/PF05175.9/5e+03,Methyltransf_32/PF13679.1/0.13,Methyltran
MHTHQELIAHLKSQRIVTNERVMQTLTTFDRAHYIKKGAAMPYTEAPASIGFGAVLQAPYLQAIALELLEPALHVGGKALDVSCGSGYIAVCLSHLTGPTGLVCGIETTQPLLDEAYHYAHNDAAARPALESKHLRFETGSETEGHPAHAPYHAIHVGTPLPSVPQALLDQLSNGGRMVIAVGTTYSFATLHLVEKDAHGTVKQTLVSQLRKDPHVAPTAQEQAELDAVEKAKESAAGNVQYEEYFDSEKY